MSHPADPDDVSSQRSTQQSTEGDKNQVIGEVVESTIYHISDTGHITINQVQNLPSIAETIKAQPLIQRSPYLGLRKFEVRDKDLFFGRDQLISRLLSRLQETPFLLILGASGSGKSSLVRAGLIPNLSHVLGTGFRELIFTPDRDPFDSFRSSLRSAGFRQADLESLQTGQPETIVQVVRSLKSADEDWLIFIDQFEELFTLCQNLQQRQAFVNGLIQLVQSELPSLRLVLAMRADFLDRLGAYPQLTGILQRSELITDMGNDELRLAIEKPAAHHGVVLEPELTEEVIHDLKGRPDTVSEAERVSLPLLQYTLKLLWENSEDLIRDRTLRVSTYRSLGGVRGALQRHVDEIYAPLPDEQKQAAKHIFLQLVDVTSADAGTTAVGKAVSRRAALSEFSPAEQEVLRRLVDAGLLVSDDPETHAGLLSPDTPSRDRKATVELAHETLIDAWDTLKAWIEESRPLIRTKNQLREDAHRWHEMYQTNRAQAEAELWQGRKLQWLLSQKQEIEARFGQFKSKELQFIEACEELCDRQRRAELKRQEKQKKLYRRIAAGATTSLFLVTSMAIVALHQWRAAERGQLEALIASSEANFQLHPGSLDALANSIEAGHKFQQSLWLKYDSDLRQRVMEVLGQALYQAKEYNRLMGHGRSVVDLSFSSAQQTLITVSYDNTVRVWEMNGQPKQVLTLPDQYLTSISINPDENLLAVGSYGGTVNIINLKEGSVLPLEGHDGPVWDVTFSSNGQTLVTAGDDGTLRFWEVTGKALESKTVNATDTKLRSVATSQNGQWIVAGRDDGKILLLNNQGNIIRTLSKHTSGVFGIAFSPDSKSVATAGFDKQIIIWDIDSGEVKATLKGHLDRIRSVAFSPDGKTVASSSYDGDIKLWNIRGELLETLKADTSGGN